MMSTSNKPKLLNKQDLKHLEKRCRIKLTPVESKRILQEINNVVLPRLYRFKKLNKIDAFPPQFHPLRFSQEHFRSDVPSFTTREFFQKNTSALNSKGYIVVLVNE